MSVVAGAWVAAAAVRSGAAIGALTCWGAGIWLNARRAGFPLGTLFVNSAGGLVAGAAARRSPWGPSIGRRAEAAG